VWSQHNATGIFGTPGTSLAGDAYTETITTNPLLNSNVRTRSARLALEAEGAGGRLNKQSDEHGRAAERRPLYLRKSPRSILSYPERLARRLRVRSSLSPD